jgi:succinyl-diaminopimelate desuccinylase
MSLAQDLLWLCSIPSPIGEEQALCDAVEARLSLRSLGAPIRRYGDSLVVPLRRGSGGPHVILGGHLDVVRTEHDGAPRIDGDKLYAPGAADMKSGLTLMLALAERPKLRALDLTLVFYAREEGPYAENELGEVLTADPELTSADVAVMLEPSDNKLQLGCGGSIHATARFNGRTAHSARPWQGENAIHKSAALLTRLNAREPVTDERDGLVWRNVISATMGAGGRARHIIPDVFELVAGEADVQFVDISPSAPPLRQHPLVAALAESGVLAVEPKQAWTDVARFASLGVPAVNFGPGVQAQAHQKNEWTLLPQLDVGLAVLERWLDRIGGKGP